jgi:hypothetical protein
VVDAIVDCGASLSFFGLDVSDALGLTEELSPEEDATAPRFHLDYDAG